jgi:flagellar hook-associated protein 1 FlgK
MPSSFSGLSTALSALTAQRRALDVAGQNIANANTEGYSRQRVELTSVGGSAVPAVWSIWHGAGAGVAVAGVDRVRDAFLDARNNTEHAANAYLSNEQQVYGQVEQLISEPGDTGLQAQLADVWAAWHDVANNPRDLAARSTLLQQAATVAGSLNSRHEGLGSLWSASRDQLDALVADVNSTAGTLAELNQAVVRAQAAGLPANELADQRDQLVLKLADLAGATAVRRDDGAVNVLLAGSTLVSGASVRQLGATGARRLDDQATVPAALQWLDNGTPATVPSGQIASVMQTLGVTVPHYADALDQVAARLASTVNAQHAAGYDLSGTAGGTFFVGTTAASIAVAITDPAAVAASATPGGNLDGGNADAMAALATVAGGADLSYRQLVAELGATTHTVNQRAAIQANLTAAAGAAVASVSGVSLDEEMANMLTYQRAYEAAARVVSTVDSVLDTLINRTGLVR